MSEWESDPGGLKICRIQNEYTDLTSYKGGGKQKGGVYCFNMFIDVNKGV